MVSSGSCSFQAAESWTVERGPRLPAPLRLSLEYSQLIALCFLDNTRTSLSPIFFPLQFHLPLWSLQNSIKRSRSSNLYSLSTSLPFSSHSLIPPSVPFVGSTTARHLEARSEILEGELASLTGSLHVRHMRTDTESSPASKRSSSPLSAAQEESPRITRPRSNSHSGAFSRANALRQRQLSEDSSRLAHITGQCSLPKAVANVVMDRPGEGWSEYPEHRPRFVESLPFERSR